MGHKKLTKDLKARDMQFTCRLSQQQTCTKTVIQGTPQKRQVICSVDCHDNMLVQDSRIPVTQGILQGLIERQVICSLGCHNFIIQAKGTGAFDFERNCHLHLCTEGFDQIINKAKKYSWFDYEIIVSSLGDYEMHFKKVFRAAATIKNEIQCH